jgi:hypothetical protein
VQEGGWVRTVVVPGLPIEKPEPLFRRVELVEPE